MTEATRNLNVEFNLKADRFRQGAEEAARTMKAATDSIQRGTGEAASAMKALEREIIALGSASSSMSQKATESTLTWGKLAGAMGIGFSAAQLVQGAIVKVGESLKFASEQASKYEASMRTLQIVSDRTGGNFAENKRVVQDFSDAISSPAAAAQAVRVFQTMNLSAEQQRTLIRSIRDGIVAMGGDVNEQLPMMALAIKRQESALLDNMGVTKTIETMYKEFARTIGTTADKLTQQQKEQAVVNGVLKELKTYAGVAENSLNSYQGSVNRLNSSLQQLGVTVGENVNPYIKAMNITLANLADQINIAARASMPISRGPLESTPFVGADGQPVEVAPRIHILRGTEFVLKKPDEAAAPAAKPAGRTHRQPSVHRNTEVYGPAFKPEYLQVFGPQLPIYQDTVTPAYLSRINDWDSKQLTKADAPNKAKVIADTREQTEKVALAMIDAAGQVATDAASGKLTGGNVVRTLAGLGSALTAANPLLSAGIGVAGGVAGALFDQIDVGGYRSANASSIAAMGTGNESQLRAKYDAIQKAMSGRNAYTQLNLPGGSLYFKNDDYAKLSKELNGVIESLGKLQQASDKAAAAQAYAAGLVDKAGGTRTVSSLMAQLEGREFGSADLVNVLSTGSARASELVSNRDLQKQVLKDYQYTFVDKMSEDYSGLARNLGYRGSAGLNGENLKGWMESVLLPSIRDSMNFTSSKSIGSANVGDNELRFDAPQTNLNTYNQQVVVNTYAITGDKASVRELAKILAVEMNTLTQQSA